MIAILAFSIVASALVLLAGRRDAARDPRLTVSLLVLLAAFPALLAFMPKIGLLPAKAEMPVEAGLPWGRILALAWAAGIAWTMARLGLALAALHRWKKQSLKVTTVEGVEIRVLNHLSGPVAAGVRHPVVFVPISWHGWSDAYRQVVLEHELAHHRRRDPLWRILAEFACAVHWFNPVVRWMTRRLIMQCEYACDAMVLEKGIAARDYARVLCDFATGDSPSPLAPAMAEACPLEYRVRRMLAPERPLNSMLVVVLASIGLLTACSLAMIERESRQPAGLPTTDIELRWTANPFPAEP